MLNHDLFKTAADKPNVVLIHGLFGDKDNLTLLRKALQDDCNVMSIDLPNHGKSPHIEQWTFPAVIEGLEATFTQQNFQPDAIIGHSLGGKVAMSYALHHPTKLQALVVADMAPVAYPARHDSVFEALNAVAQANIENRQQAMQIMASILADTGTQQFLLKSLKKSASGWQWQFNLAGLERDYPTLCNWPYSAESTSSPVLFVKGGNSDYLTHAHTEAVGRHFSATSVKVIGDTGHWLHAEKPDLFNRIVTKFLQQTLM